jgi:hypothetical protein
MICRVDTIYEKNKKKRYVEIAYFMDRNTKGNTNAKTAVTGIGFIRLTMQKSKEARDLSL